MGWKRVVLTVIIVLIAILARLVLKEVAIEGAANPVNRRMIQFMFSMSQDYVPMIASSLGLSTMLHMRRVGCERSAGWIAPGVKMEDAVLEGVPVRLYYPPGADQSQNLRPGIVYYHGGGWVICHLDSHAPSIGRMSLDVGAVVVAVGYRRAPEHRYGDLFDDNYKVTRLFLEKARDFGVDPQRIALAGDSAGGQLTLSMALRLRDEEFRPSPKLLVSIYPVTQFLDLALPSYQQNPDGPFIKGTHFGWYFSNLLLGNDSKAEVFMRNAHVPRDVRAKMAAGYINHDKIPEQWRYPPYRPPVDPVNNDVIVDESVWKAIRDTVLDPYLSPLLADDLSGLPETILYTGKYDVLRDEGILMVQRLQEGGVRVLHIMDPLGWHPNFLFFYMDEDAEHAVAGIIQAVKERL